MPNSMQKIKVSVIGGGNMGKNHLRNYFLMPDIDLVGLADINLKTKELADEYKCNFFTDYKKMLDELKPDAVSIVVPTPLHAEVASEVIKRGIHCLLEKPIASTVKQADELIRLANKNKIVFSVGHIEHYNPLIIKLKDIIDNNKIGDISSIVCKRVGGFPAVEPKTDVVIDLAVHDIGIISFLLNRKPERIYSHGSRTYHSKAIDSAEILIDYGSASGFIQANWVTPVKVRTIAITGSDGYIEGNYITQELELYEHNTAKYKNDGFSDFVTKLGEPKKEVVKVEFKEPLRAELNAFISTIKGDKVYLVNGLSARDALELALEAVEPYKSVSI